MSKKTEIDRLILESDYKQQLLNEMLGQFTLPAESVTRQPPGEQSASTLLSAKSVIAQRQCGSSDLNNTGERVKYRRPLVMRGFLI